MPLTQSSSAHDHLSFPTRRSSDLIIHGAESAPEGRTPRWIRADVRLAPGFSGGPLADATGRQIGRARLNSSHTVISYAVFCLKKKNKENLYSQRVCYYTTYCC